MKILTSGEMKEIDRIAIEEIGIPGSVLMENAGIRITEAILNKFPKIEDENVVIVAGKGNNGETGSSSPGIFTIAAPGRRCFCWRPRMTLGVTRLSIWPSPKSPGSKSSTRRPICAGRKAG